MLFGVLNNVGHAPIFALFAVVVLLLLRRRPGMQGPAGYGLALLIAVAAGAAVEVVQPQVGRSADIRDLVMDALGAAGGLSLAAVRLAPAHRIVTLLIALAAFTAAFWPLGQSLTAYRERSRQFPTLLDFDKAPDWYFLQLQGLALEDEASTCAADSSGRNGVSFRIAGGLFPGITHSEPESDWSRYRRLKLDLSNPGSSPLPLTLRVQDMTHDKRMEDRFNREIMLPSATRAIVDVALEDIAAGPAWRRLDLRRVDGFILFARSDSEWVGRRFCVHRIWLE